MLMHRQTDMTILIAAFQNFVKKGPKITIIQLNNRRVTLIHAITNLVTVMFL